MTDYTYPSVYFAYLFFAISAVLCVFFFIRSWKDGYWGKEGEEIKYQVFEERCGAGTHACRVGTHADALPDDESVPAGVPARQTKVSAPHQE